MIAALPSRFIQGGRRSVGRIGSLGGVKGAFVDTMGLYGRLLAALWLQGHWGSESRGLVTDAGRRHLRSE
jgi:hypothetical protein